MASETSLASVMTNPTTRDPTVTGRSTIQQLMDQNLEEFKEALVNHVAVQFQHQGQLLEEARRDLDTYKKALFDVERAKNDLEERFEQEKQALNDEIRQLRECGVHGLEERFEQGGQPLNDEVPQPKTTVTREEGVVHQQDPSPAPAGTQQHAIVREDTATA